MVDSGSGRTDLAETGQRWPEPGLPTEPEHRDVREPRTALARVDAEPLEPLEHVDRESPCVTAQVVEDEHADAARLPVAELPEREGAGGGCRSAELDPDGRSLGCGAATEEGDSDVQISARHDAVAREYAPLPFREPVEHRVRERESAEEPESFTAFDGSA